MENTPKKKFYKKVWFWILVIIIILIIASSGSSTPKKVGSNNTTDTTTVQSQNQTYKVGDKIQLGDSIVTVNNVSFSQGSEFAKPSTGNKYINLNITIQNTGSTQQYITTLGQMFLRDADGNSYQISVTDKIIENMNKSLDGAVIANSKRTGWVGFEIPNNTKGLQFQYNGSLFGGGIIVVDLD
jgi:hypothetical protein